MTVGLVILYFVSYELDRFVWIFYQQIWLFFISVSLWSSAESTSVFVLSSTNFFWLHLRVIWSATRLWVATNSCRVLMILWSSSVYLDHIIWCHTDHQFPWRSNFPNPFSVLNLSDDRSFNIELFRLMFSVDVALSALSTASDFANLILLLGAWGFSPLMS